MIYKSACSKYLTPGQHINMSRVYTFGVIWDSNIDMPSNITIT